MAIVHGVNLNDGSTPGIGIGETGTFELTFSSLTIFTAMDFLNEFSSCDFGGCGNGPVNFLLVRFQAVGPDGQGSDFAVVPEPGTLGLLGAGLIGFALRRRRRGNRANGSASGVSPRL